ncbi:hypothetical protein L208DRAFT_1395399 [Tricholoma matsutake]|nr:hypothetical protein L208DRAFT_1395399 [Tricholoma matsutake 945]
MNWKQSKYIWSNHNLLSVGAISNLNVCVITCQLLNENGQNKQYLDVKDGICYSVDLEDPRKYSIYMLDRRQLESHSPEFVIPTNGRSPEQTRAEILQNLVAYVHPPAGLSRCGLCDLWVLNVMSCQFLEPLFTSRTCSEHIHFNIRGRVIRAAA